MLVSGLLLWGARCWQQQHVLEHGLLLPLWWGLARVLHCAAGPRLTAAHLQPTTLVGKVQAEVLDAGGVQLLLQGLSSLIWRGGAGCWRWHRGALVMCRRVAWAARGGTCVGAGALGGVELGAVTAQVPGLAAGHAAGGGGAGGELSRCGRGLELLSSLQELVALLQQLGLQSCCPPPLSVAV